MGRGSGPSRRPEATKQAAYVPVLARQRLVCTGRRAVPGGSRPRSWRVTLGKPFLLTNSSFRSDLRVSGLSPVTNALVMADCHHGVCLLRAGLRAESPAPVMRFVSFPAQDSHARGHHPHFTDGETEAQRGQAGCPRPPSSLAAARVTANTPPLRPLRPWRWDSVPVPEMRDPGPRGTP